MRRTATTIVALLVIGATIAVVPATGAALARDDTTDDGDDATEPSPGERLSGVLGVQQAEFEGDLADRSFGVAVASAASDDAKADAVAAQLRAVEDRLADLEQRRDELEAAREQGEISEGEYRAKVAAVEAERETARRLAERSNETAGQLPADVLESKGIDVGAIRTLQQRAENLTGPEVAAIAQGIAGPDAGAGTVENVSDAVPEDVGPDATGEQRDRTDREDGQRDGGDETAGGDAARGAAP